MIGFRNGVICVVLGVAFSVGAGQPDGEPWVPEIAGPQYVALSVSDVDGAVAWYRAAFGLDVVDDTLADDGAWRIVNLANERLRVEVIRNDRDRPATGRTTGFAKVGFRVASVETVADRVERATGERPRVVDFARHRLRILQLRDPEGNTFQLTSPLPAAP